MLRKDGPVDAEIKELSTVQNMRTAAGKDKQMPCMCLEPKTHHTMCSSNERKQEARGNMMQMAMG